MTECQANAVSSALTIPAQSLSSQSEAVSPHFQKGAHTHNPDCSLQWSISSPYLLTACGFKFTRESLLGLSNRTKERPALPSEPGNPHIQCFNCSGKNEAFMSLMSHSIFKKKISCDILIPFCARVFLDFLLSVISNVLYLSLLAELHIMSHDPQ